MRYVSNLQEKEVLISKEMTPYIGSKVIGYEIAQLYSDEDSTWSNWLDLPVFLLFDQRRVLSVSWNKFADLSMSSGRELPFSLNGSVVRWISEGIHSLDSTLGKQIVGVSIGQGSMTLEDSELEIWSRLLIELSGGEILEIFNALDENGFEFHSNKSILDQHCLKII